MMDVYTCAVRSIHVCRPVEKEAAYFTKPGAEKRTGEDGSTSQGLESACTVSTVLSVCLTA